MFFTAIPLNFDIESVLSDELETDMGSKDERASSDRSPRAAHRYRETRSCLARRRVNNGTSFSLRNFLDGPESSEVSSLIHGSYGAESKRWASPRRQTKPHPKENAQSPPSITRTFTPWKNNDPDLERTFKKRVLSARMNRTRGSEFCVDSPLLIRPKSTLPSIGLSRSKSDISETNEKRAVRNSPTYIKVRNQTVTFQEKIPPRILSKSTKVLNSVACISTKSSCHKSVKPSIFNKNMTKTSVKKEENRKYSPAGYMKTHSIKINSFPIKFATVLKQPF